MRKGERLYLDFFSFSEKPFDVTPNTRFLYLSPQHEEAIDVLVYGVKDRRGFMMLTGEVGTGKTTSVRAFLNRLGTQEKNIETALILNPILSTLDLMKTINRDFGLEVDKGDSVHEQIETLNRFLLQNAQKGGNAVVIIDEAQNLSPEALEMARLLSNLETETHKLLQLILVGQPELDNKLKKPELRQLRQRLQLRHTLHPLNLEETKRYVLFRLNRASPKCCLVFEPAALKRIYEYSGGIPRLINTIGELTLLAAYTQETHVITRKIVEIASRDMIDRSSYHPLSFWKRWRRQGGAHVSPL